MATYCNVSSHSVLTKFPSAAPCLCHRKNDNNSPIYDVQISTGIPARLGLGHIIKKIHIECSRCGKEATTDVEHLEVYEKQFNPK